MNVEAFEKWCAFYGIAISPHITTASKQEHDCRAAFSAGEIAAMRLDAERLTWCAIELGIDEIGDIDLHDKATELADGEPHRIHYLEAIRAAIDIEIKRENPRQLVAKCPSI